jgi:hypothetical protein
MKKTKIQAVALTLILMGSVFVGIGTQVERASATHECGSADMMIAIFSAGTMNKDKCGNNHVGHIVEELEENERNQTRVNIYEGSVEQIQNTENFEAGMGNYLNDTRSVAWSKAEAKAYNIIQEKGANTTVANVHSRVNNTIRNYYDKKRININSAWNTHILSIKSLVNQSEVQGVSVIKKGNSGNDAKENVSTSSFYEVQITIGNEVYSHWVFNEYQAPDGNNFGTLNIVNASTNKKPIQGHQDPYLMTPLSNWNEKDVSGNPKGFLLSGNSRGFIYAKAPNSTSYDNVLLIGSGEVRLNGSYLNNEYNFKEDISSRQNMHLYEKEWNRTWANQQYVQRNIGPVIKSMYDKKVNDGKVLDSDYLSCDTLAQEYSTDYNTTGHWSYAMGHAACAGYSLPDLNKSARMIVDYNGNEYVGQVMSQNAPGSGMWEAGVTYDTSNIKGSQFILTYNNTIKEMNGQFTVKSIYDKNNKTLDSVNTQEYYYETQNVSDLQETQDKISQLRYEIEQNEPVAQTAGTGGSGTFIPQWLKETYFQIPLYGWAIVVMLMAYLANAIRGNN